MASPPYKLNPSQPTLNVSLPYAAAWVYVDNPSTSAVLVRLGGTDIPTTTSMDLYVPAYATELVPCNARDFAFKLLATTALVSQTTINTVTIIFGQVGEPSPSFGTIQQQKAFNPYDRNNAAPLVISANGIAMPASGANVTLFSEPIGFPRKVGYVAWVEFLELDVFVLTVGTAPVWITVTILYETAYGQEGTNPIAGSAAVLLQANIYTGAFNEKTVTVSPGMFLYPAVNNVLGTEDRLVLHIPITGVNGGQVVCDARAKIQEFQA